MNDISPKTTRRREWMTGGTRSVLGVAGATLAPSSLSLIRSLFPDERRRTVAIGVWMSCFAAGAAVGPLVGGTLLHQFWWGSVFLLNVPVMALMLALAPRVLPESRDPSPGRFDLAGAALSVVALLALVYGVKRVADGLDALAVLSALAGLAVGALFVSRSRRVAAPLIDLSLFRAPAIRVSITAMVLATFVMAGMLLFVAQYLQLVRGMGPLEAGVWSVPAMLGSITGSMLAPALAARFRKGLVLAGSMAVAAEAIPANVGPEAAEAARDTLGAAVGEAAGWCRPWWRRPATRSSRACSLLR